MIILQRIISLYNIPLYREINKKYKVLLAYSQKAELMPDDIDVQKVQYPPYQEFKNMTDIELSYFIDEMLKFCCGYDIIVLPMEPHAKMLHVIEKLRKRIKVILWGIGVAASYNTRYDSEEYQSPSFASMISIADAGIFYSSYPVEKYQKCGIPKNKMFVAHNTVEVLSIEQCKQKKNSFLFVGTLLKQKRVDLLLQSYKDCVQRRSDVPDLIIIGSGEEYAAIREWIDQNKLSDKVFMTGAVYEEEKLRQYFLNAYAVISPDQAGLSVLKAMGYGVPFITSADAITGGEIFNIKDGVTGVLLHDLSELTEVLCDVAGHPGKYRQLGENAYRHYHSSRTIGICAEGFFSAADYVLS